MSTVPSPQSSSSKRAVGIFNNLRKAKEAVRELRGAGFDKNSASVIAQEADEHPEVESLHVGELNNLGIPQERAKAYRDRINQGEYIVTVNGVEESLHKAKQILHGQGIQEWEVYVLSEHPEVLVVDHRHKI